MASKLESPVQTQMAVSAFNSISNGQYHGNRILKPVRTRRVFVQTETGCVLGLELDQNDNAHSVKRRMQIALNVPTDESSLTFGDLTLNNDLSAIRNDSPLLLTRNAMHRSSSTPCLSPAWKNLQPRDGSGLVEILGFSTHSSGTTELEGHYGCDQEWGENVAIVKPADEEPFAPNNPKGFVGKALGQPVTHSIFNVNDGVNRNKLQDKKVVSKIASLQQFIPHDFDAGDHGTSSFPVDAIHRIGILDIRIFNTDWHAGNLLVRKLGGVGGFSQFELIPIDHGLCLPESLEDPYFEWIHWPQASIPFSEDELEYIKNINPMLDSDMLRAELPMIREACLRVLVLCSIFLKEAAAFGLCLAEIGEMMSREFHALEEEPSELELVCIEAKELVMEINMPFFEADERDDEFQFDIDCKEAEVNFTPNTTRDLPAKALIRHWSETMNNLNFLAEVDEDIEASEIQVDEEPVRARNAGSLEEDWFHTASRLSLSLKRINNLGPKGFHYHGQKPERTHTMDYSSRMRSANEQLLTSTSFVKFADMNEEEWNLFIVKVKKLLCPAFANRRSRTIGERQRLGTSC
ncbi:hypothetical protein GOBAR_DD04859 [Gossypium barbadense]|nr:hypothetical protein GOBAR_DD04859 [Gossypium barbadense]